MEGSTEEVNSRGAEDQMSKDREGALLGHEQPLGEQCPWRGWSECSTALRVR